MEDSRQVVFPSYQVGACCLPLLLCATHHSCTKLERRVPGRCLPSPRPPGRRPLCPHLRLRGAGQSAANHGMFPRAPGGMLGDRGRRETQLKDRAGPSWGHGGSVGTVDTHSSRGWAQRMPALNMQKTWKWSGEGQLTVHEERAGDGDLNAGLWRTEEAGSIDKPGGRDKSYTVQLVFLCMRQEDNCLI